MQRLFKLVLLINLLPEAFSGDDFVFFFLQSGFVGL